MLALEVYDGQLAGKSLHVTSPAPTRNDAPFERLPFASQALQIEVEDGSEDQLGV